MLHGFSDRKICFGPPLTTMNNPNHINVTLPTSPQQYVPRANERPTMAPKSNKNFLKTNVMDATKKTPSKSSIDKTHTKGEIPQYLSRRKEETAKAHDMANTLRQQQMEHNRTTTQLSAHDR